MTNTDEPLKEILEKARGDNNQLVYLVAGYLGLIASSNKHWVDYYQKDVSDTVWAWKDKYKTAEALFHIIQGYTEYFSTRYNEALVSFENIFKCTNNTYLFKDIRGLALIGQGVSYRSIGLIDKSLENILLGTKEVEKDGPFIEWYGYSYYHLGEIHVYIGEYNKAEEYYLEAMEVMKELDMPTPKFRVYDGLGVCYSKMGELEKSEMFFSKALAVKGISPAEKARGLCDLGILYLEDPDKALPYFEESCSIRKKNKLEDAFSTSLIYQGDCLLKKGELEKADKVLHEALNIATRYDIPTKKLHLYRLLGQLFELKKDTDQALKYFHLYNELQVNTNSQQIKNIFQLKNKQIAKQHDEIEQKHAQLKSTLNELARIKVSRRSAFFSIITVVILVMSTEVFLDPLIEKYSYNVYLSLGSKVMIAFFLKPIENLYERLLLKKALEVNV